MESLRNTNLEQIVNKIPRKKARRVASLALAASALFVTAPTEGKTPYIPSPVPQEEFRDVRDLILPTPSPTPLEIKLSPEEQKIQEFRLKAEGIQTVALQNSDIVKSHWADDLLIYGPIYIAAAEKYGIDWKILWINHEFETGASAFKSKAFDPNSQSQYEGGMQIGPTWSEEYMNDAFLELEYLNIFPQRHEGDARNVATAAKMIAANYNKYKDLGDEKAYFNAIKLFTGSEDLAMQRMEVWLKLNKVYPPKAQ